MQKKLSIASITAATAGAVIFATAYMVLPAIGCAAWMLFWLYCQTFKKPRPSHERGNEKRVNTKILNFYSSTVTIGTQTKIKTPAGKMLMSVNYEE